MASLNPVTQTPQAVFYRLKLIESYGTGIRKIIGLYNGFTPQPNFWSAEGGFKVTLYNRNEKVVDGPSDSIYASIYALALGAGKITRKEVDDKFGFSTTKSFNFLKKMCAFGLLQQKKCGYQTVYVPKNKNSVRKDSS